MLRWSRAPVALVVLLALAVGCADESGTPSAGTPAPSASPTATDSPTAAPTEAASSPAARGGLHATLEQYTIDASRGRMQAWIDNDTGAPITPTRIVYSDPRLGAAVLGERLRTIPPGSRRGYPLALTDRPRCRLERDPDAADAARLELHDESGVHPVPLTDDVGIVARHLASRCLERAVARSARLRWADRVPVDGAGADSRARLVLRVEPTGRGERLEITEVNGSHLFAPVEGSSWTPGLAVDRRSRPTSLRLPLIPARCDGHAFAEGGNATAFRVHVRVGAREGAYLLRMSSEGARAALDFALDHCGLPVP